MFQYDDSCMALLMDGSAALGLDLSFATQVSLMELIMERMKALQEVNKEVRCSRDEDGDARHIDKLLWPSQRSNMGVPSLQNFSILGNKSCKTLPEKVLIFSQFLVHIHFIQQQVAVISL